jgi:hypothetical protein
MKYYPGKSTTGELLDKALSESSTLKRLFLQANRYGARLALVPQKFAATKRPRVVRF